MFNHTSLRETQAETPQRVQLASVRKAVLRKQIITNAGEDVDADKRSLMRPGGDAGSAGMEGPQSRENRPTPHDPAT